MLTCDTCDGFGISPWVVVDGRPLRWTRSHHLPVYAEHLQFGPCLEGCWFQLSFAQRSHESVAHLEQLPGIDRVGFPSGQLDGSSDF